MCIAEDDQVEEDMLAAIGLVSNLLPPESRCNLLDSLDGLAEGRQPILLSRPNGKHFLKLKGKADRSYTCAVLIHWRWKPPYRLVDQ